MMPTAQTGASAALSAALSDGLLIVHTLILLIKKKEREGSILIATSAIRIIRLPLEFVRLADFRSASSAR